MRGRARQAIEEVEIMKILAVDSSGVVASIALVTEDALVAEYSVDYKKTHSQTLLPMIDELMRMTETDPNTIDGIAIAAGPGSFTGLRIGASTVKGLGMVWDKPIIPVETVNSLACNYHGTESVICPLMDARRGQVYTGLFDFVGDELRVLEPQCCIMAEEIFRKANALGRPIVFLGDGVSVNRRLIEEMVTVPYRMAPAHMAKQRAGSLGWLAGRYLANGQVVSAVEFVPEYLRQSQAERERAERHGI